MTEFGRFWSKAEVGDSDDCWLWQASRNGAGYGKFYSSSQDRIIGAHVMAYQLTFGRARKGLDVCHSCDCKTCVNPSHLFAGTRSDNMQDMLRKRRSSRLKLTADLVAEVIELLRHGVSQQKIADAVGIHQGTVSKIKLGKLSPVLFPRADRAFPRCPPKLAPGGGARQKE